MPPEKCPYSFNDQAKEAAEREESAMWAAPRVATEMKRRRVGAAPQLKQLAPLRDADGETDQSV